MVPLSHLDSFGGGSRASDNCLRAPGFRLLPSGRGIGGRVHFPRGSSRPAARRDAALAQNGRRLPERREQFGGLQFESGVRMTAVKAVPDNTTREEAALDQPWNVVVHNDPVNLMVYVTMVFRKVFGFSREKAESHMLEVHHKGRSIVWSGARERAELYVQQLHAYLLLATMERRAS